MRKHHVITGLASTVAIVALALADGNPGGVIVSGPDLLTGRMAHKIATLPDGEVLVVGGRAPGFISISGAELWNPQSNAWRQISVAAEQQDECAFVRLGDGRYLVAGGAYDGGGTPGYNAASIFDPKTKEFTATSSMTYRRFQCGGAQLTGGNVLIAGGWYGGGGSALYGEIYDTSTMSFSHTTGPMSVERSAPLVLPCDDGTALVVGGYPPYGGASIESVDSYDPVANEFTLASDHLVPGDAGWNVYASTITPRAIEDQRTSGGSYLLIAYRSSGAGTEQSLVTFDPATRQFALFPTTPALPQQDAFAVGQQPIVDRDRGRAYLVGQVLGTSADFAVYAVDLATHELTVPTGTYHMPVTYYPSYAAATVLTDGRLFLTGGMGDTTYSNAIATTLFVTPGAAAPVRQFVLPTKITRKLNAKTPAKDVLNLTATLDTGPDAAAFDSTASFTIGSLTIPLSGLTPDKKGVWRVSSPGYSFAIVPGAAGSSRCTMTAALKGSNALAVGAEESIAVRMACGTVSAKGGCTLSKSAFTLGKGPLPVDTSVPVSAKATLAGGGKDSFTLKWVVAPNDPPAQMQDIVVSFGPTYSKTIPGASFKRRGAVFTFTDKSNVLPSMTINEATGFITVTAKKADLGTFVQGAQAVRLTAGPADAPTVVDVRMVRRGRSLTY
jgi:hypothetical protein